MRLLIASVALVVSACSDGAPVAPWSFAEQPPSVTATSERVFHNESDIRRVQAAAPTPASRDAAAAWRDFHRAWPVRAFAVSAAGEFGSGVNFQTGQTDMATARAIEQCRSRASSPADAATCRPYAVNNDIVLPGREYRLPTARLAIGPFSYREEGFLRGPSAARGVIIWSHGYYGRCAEQRQFPIHPWVADLNNEGWDVLRYDRDPCSDGDYLTVMQTLARSIPLLRAAGYRDVVLAGQSRGAWQAMDAAAAAPRGSVRAVVAVAPARFGSANDTANQHLRMLDEWRAMMPRLREAGVTVLTFLFEGDEYDAEPRRRAEIQNAVLGVPGRDGRPAFSRAHWFRDSFGARTPHGSGSTPRFRDAMQSCISSVLTHGRACVVGGGGDGDSF